MASKLMNRFESTYQLFSNCIDPNRKDNNAGWSIKEIVGHLIDSASNNHQRLLRYVSNGELSFPSYDQESFVSRANYKNFEYLDLLTLWYLHNKLLFHIYDNIPEGDLESSIKVGDRPAMSIRQLMEDYFAHLMIHENQLMQIMDQKEHP
jgi:hypothetical protein